MTRISTSLLYQTNINTLNQRQADQLQLQQQLATGRRVVLPSDDPVASARALEVVQSQNVNQIYSTNQLIAGEVLRYSERQLEAVSDIVSYLRERAIQAGNGALAADDKAALATDVRAQFDQLLGIANSTDANGEYLFAGFRGDTLPFTGTVNGGVTYHGDQGVRTLQISATRQLPVSESGFTVFQQIPNLNGAFNTSTGATNSGGAIVSDGTVLGGYGGGSYSIQFTGPGTYDIYDGGGALLASGTYGSGTPIDLPPAPATAEIQVTVSGNPTGGDVFNVAPGGSTDLFAIVQNFVGALENTSGPEYTAAIQETLGRLDNALDSILSLRALSGSRQLEADALQNLSLDLEVQYADRLGSLIQVDYTEAISNFSQLQTYLQAAQQSFVTVTGLSLFDFLG